MQSGREEERYAIQFCFQLGKNAREMYGMLQNAFGAFYMNRASVFERHKRFKKEPVRDDYPCVGGVKSQNTRFDWPKGFG